tara:strand:+ start:77 stop:769 length:693 start_codon:yes stop_codon:yes gene_type:complete
MIITTWNIRQGGGKRIQGIIDFIKINSNSDVLILTEYRNNLNKEIIEKSLKDFGYINIITTNSEPRINSILVACKTEFKAEVFNQLKDHRQRVIKIKSPNLSIYGCYFPQKKLKSIIFEFLLNEIKKNDKENIIITGDFNTGKHYLDEKGASFHCSEYIEKLENKGMVDAWRLINGSKKEYSWYSNAGNGFRIDHFFISDSIKNKLSNCFYNHAIRENKISDHSSMTLEF